MNEFKDLKFKIINIKRDRCLNGSTHIEAICTKDNQKLEITLLNSEFQDRSIIRSLLVYSYKVLMEEDYSVKVGDIL